MFGSVENLTTPPLEVGDGGNVAGPALRLAIYSLLSLGIVVSNAVIIITYWSIECVRRDVGNTFIVNMSYADLLVGLVKIPLFGFMDYRMGVWSFGEVACKLVMTVVHLGTAIPVVIVILFIAYRRLMICRSARMRSLVKRRHVVIAMASLWIGQVTVSTFIAFGLPEITGASMVDYETQCAMEYYFMPSFALAMTIIEFCIPAITIVCLGVAMVIGITRMPSRIAPVKRNPDLAPNSAANFVATRMNTAGAWSPFVGGSVSEQLKRPGCADIPLPDQPPPRDATAFLASIAGPSTTRTHLECDITSPTTDQPFRHAGPSTSSSPCQSLSPIASNHHAQRNPNQIQTISQNVESRQRSHRGLADSEQTPRQPVGGQARPRERRILFGPRKAAVMVLIFVTVYSLFWMPFAITSIVAEACDCVSRNIYPIVVFLFMSNSLVNPFVYAGTNPRFRRGIAKVLRLKR